MRSRNRNRSIIQDHTLSPALPPVALPEHAQEATRPAVKATPYSTPVMFFAYEAKKLDFGSLAVS